MTTRETAREPQNRKSRIFLVDDHALVRENLTALLGRESDLEVCGEAEDALSARLLITQTLPDLVILDLSLKRSNGLQLLRQLKQSLPKLPVLVLSMHDETMFAERALRAGAMGYISKEEASVDVMPAIRKVLGGGRYLSERMAGRLSDQLASGAFDTPFAQNLMAAPRPPK